MMSPAETRNQRRWLIRQALAQVVRQRIARQRLRQTDVGGTSGISRTHFQSMLRAEKSCSLFVFVELSRGLEIEPGELLRDVLSRQDLLRER